MHFHPAGGLLQSERFRPMILHVMQKLMHLFSGALTDGFCPVTLAGQGPSLARLRQPVEQFQQQPDPENSGTSRVNFGHQGLRLLGRFSMEREAAPGFVHQAANSETFRRGPEVLAEDILPKLDVTRMSVSGFPVPVEMGEAAAE